MVVKVFTLSIVSKKVLLPGKKSLENRAVMYCAVLIFMIILNKTILQ